MRKSDYKKYITHCLKVYLEDVIVKTFPNAKLNDSIETYWDSLIFDLPFRIICDDVIINKEHYEAFMEYRNWELKGYDTHYGMIVLYLTNKDTETTELLIVNPSTLKTDYGLDQSEEELFYQDLAYWPKDFKSEQYTYTQGEEPDLKDVILTYEQNKRMKLTS